MKGLLTIIGMVIAMSIVLAIFTEYGADGDAKMTVMGLPVISVRQGEAHGWLAMGQTASGVLVIAQCGVGVVAFVQGGAAAVFGIGQGMVSLVALAQIGVGAFAFVGQVGFGAQAIGQGVARRKSAEYFKDVSDEVTALLSWSGQ